MRVLWAGAAAYPLLASLGCAAPPQTTVSPSEAVDSGEHVVRPGNVLGVSLWPDPENNVSGDFTVEETGLVYLPVVGVVRVGGLPIDSVRRVLREGYAEAFQQPVVTVALRFRVSIYEAVRAPGLYWAEPTWSLLDLISEAGGFQPNAKEDQLRLIRNGSALDFDAENYLRTGEGSVAVPLYSGDRIVVPRSRTILTAQNIQILLATANLVIAILALAR